MDFENNAKLVITVVLGGGSSGIMHNAYKAFDDIYKTVTGKKKLNTFCCWQCAASFCRYRIL